MKTTPLSPQAARGPGRPREFDTDAVLDRAVLWFREHGYSGTSIGDLSAATGLSAGSLYKAFKDKQGLFKAALSRYTRVRGAQLNQRVTGAGDARARLWQVLEYYADSAHDIEGRRGCLVVIAAAELASIDDEVAREVRQVLARNEERLYDLIVVGQQESSIRTGVDPRATARLMLALLQGLRVLGKTGRTRDEVMSVLQTAMALLA